MAKIDEIKEVLNTLRVAMSIAFGIFVLVVGKIISMYIDGKIIDIFWLSIFVAIVNMVVILVIVKYISKKIKEIRDIE
ncbi:MAG: hypothetical protein U9N34_07770 [Candidatus Cloacimonadota bacterium]|nr:hypothetical protein [Candidatus Cloacimonadota bacterium]